MQKPLIQPESPYELNRKIENIVRLGAIAQVRLGKPARCRVRTGGLLSHWVPFFSLRAGGDLLQGVALAGLFSDKLPQGSSEPGVYLQEWSDTDSVRWADGKLTIRCASAATPTAAPGHRANNPSATCAARSAAKPRPARKPWTATPPRPNSKPRAPTEAVVGFVGMAQRIARVHHFGLEDRINRGGPVYRYPARELLGVTDGQVERVERVRELVLHHLQP